VGATPPPPPSKERWYPPFVYIKNLSPGGCLDIYVIPKPIFNDPKYKNLYADTNAYNKQNMRL